MAKRGNRNAAGRRIDRNLIHINMSVSKRNGLLDLFGEYLLRQGIPDTDANIRNLAANWAYQYWMERLKREIESQEAAIIL